MMKICFYCDSIFSVGGVQRVLAVIANALAVNYEVTILTHDKPESEDLSLFGLEGTNIHFRSVAGNTCLAKHTAFYTRKESYHKYLSLHSGMDTAHFRALNEKN